MSLILDALKKMEEDKARRQRKSMELGPAILQEPAPTGGSRWRTPVLLGCAVITTAVSMYFFMDSGSNNPPSQSVPVPVQAAPAPPPVEPVLPPPVEPLVSPVPAARTPAPIAAPPVIPASPPAANATTDPDLVVNGIAWQEERRGRRAVVNGILVAEGDTVAGFRIKQIHPEKVVFISGGQSLEIMHSAPIH